MDIPGVHRGVFRAFRVRVRVRTRRRPRPPGPPGGVRWRRGREFPECPGKGMGRPAPHGGRRESVFPPVHPDLAGSGECGAECASTTAGAGSAPPASVSGESASRLVAAAAGYFVAPLSVHHLEEHDDVGDVGDVGETNGGFLRFFCTLIFLRFCGGLRCGCGFGIRQILLSMAMAMVLYYTKPK